MPDLISPSDEGRVQAMRERLAKAEATIVTLNNGEGRWRMSIPARPDDDPDLIFAAVIRDASDLLRENDALRGMVRDAEDASGRVLIELGAARAALAEAETRNAKFWRWAYALNIAAAKAQLALRNAELREANEPNTWPAQSEWNELVSSSHSIFLRAMREAAGIDHDDFLAYVRNERGERYAEIADEIYQHSASAPSGESQPHE